MIVKSLAELAQWEKTEAEKEEYRIGFRDGWEAAADAMLGKHFLGNERLYSALTSHFFNSLWRWEKYGDGLPPKDVLGLYCVYCGANAQHLDHVMPKSRGGPGEDGNLVPACRVCNSKKGARTPEEAGLSMRAGPEDMPWNVEFVIMRKDEDG